MKPDDARLARKVRSEIIRRELNTQRLEIVVTHGVAYLSGELSGTKSRRIPDGKKELEIISTVVRQVTGIRDVDNRIKWINL
jgi:osmotically-inducible protein OsmY